MTLKLRMSCILTVAIFLGTSAFAGSVENNNVKKSASNSSTSILEEPIITNEAEYAEEHNRRNTAMTSQTGKAKSKSNSASSKAVDTKGADENKRQ